MRFVVDISQKKDAEALNPADMADELLDHLCMLDPLTGDLPGWVFSIDSVEPYRQV